MTTKRFDIDVNQSGAEKAQKEINRLGMALTSTIGKYVGIGTAIAATMRLMKTSIDNYKRQELAEKKLATALGYTSQSLLDYASQLQKLTTYGDENIIEAQALIASFVKEEDAIKAATKATLDLAAAKGMELKAAADLLSKTLGSSTNALSRYGIEVTGAVGSSERLASVTENIAKVFGGQAAAEVETFAGKVEQANNDLGDLAETLGLIITKSIEGAVVGSNGLTTALNDQLKVWAALHGFYNQNIELKKDDAETTDSLLDALDKELEKRKEFKDALRESIRVKEWEAMLTAELNKELMLSAGLLRDTVTPEVSRLSAAYDKAAKSAEKIKDVASETPDYVKKSVEEMSAEWAKWGEQFSGVLSSAMMANQNFFAATFLGFKQMLERMAAEIAAKAAIFYLFDAISGGTFSAGKTAGEFIFSGFRANGGPVNPNESYVVGESGPEVFTPATAGYITPNSSGVNVNINIGGNVISSRRWVRDVLVPEVQSAAARGLA